MISLIARDGEQVSDATPRERFRSIAGEIVDNAQAGNSPTLAEAEEALELLRRDAREASRSAIAACRMQRRNSYGS